MSEPSRTTWPDWAPRPVVCCECGERVTLKQSHRCCFDARSGKGTIHHVACDPFTVTVVVSRKP